MYYYHFIFSAKPLTREQSAIVLGADLRYWFDDQPDVTVWMYENSYYLTENDGVFTVEVIGEGGDFTNRVEAENCLYRLVSEL